MLMRKKFPDMPTTTVTADLLSRFGSPTRYSLSPYQGMRSMLKGKYADLLRVPNLEAIIREKDDFEFCKDEFVCTYDTHALGGITEQCTGMAIVGEETTQVGFAAKPTDLMPPSYLMRFEDQIPEENMRTFVLHVLSNTVRQGKLYKDYLKEMEVQENTFDTGDGEDEINANELQNDYTGDKAGAAEVAKAKKDLAYCLYRLNLLSGVCHINMLSLIFAYLVANPTQASKRIGPSKLLAAKPVYYSDQHGNCTTVITDETDRSLRAAYGLINSSDVEKFKEFRSDIRKTFKCIHTLRINPRADDPALYTHEFCKRIAHDYMIDNCSYVSRKFGGYNKDVLSQLRGMSLDMVVNNSIETRIDPEETIINLICSTLSVPESIYRAFSTKYSGLYANDYYKLLELHKSDAIIELTGDLAGMQTDEAGFYLSVIGEPYTIDITNIIRVHKSYTTMQAYIHRSGWVVCLPTGPALVMARLDNFVKNFDIQDVGHIEWQLFTVDENS